MKRLWSQHSSKNNSPGVIRQNDQVIQAAGPDNVENAGFGSNESHNVGPRDAAIHGWFNLDTGCLYPNFPIGPDDIVSDAEMADVDVTEQSGGGFSGSRKRLL